MLTESDCEHHSWIAAFPSCAVRYFAQAKVLAYFEICIHIKFCAVISSACLAKA